MTTTDTDPFPPQVLREYALLADGERGTLVGPRGDTVWMCAPRWDSGALFSALLGGCSGYSVTPTGRFVWGGFYEEGTLIWRSRWITQTGIIECREALAFPGDPHRAVLLRRIIAVDADARVQVTLTPRADFDADPLPELREHDDRWTATTGGLHLRLAGAAFCRPSFDPRQGLIGEITVPAGAHHDLVLEISDQPLRAEPIRPDIAWQATETAWALAVPALHNTLDARDSRRAYAVMRGLTSAGGGMVAAATTSMPERAEAGRNYDYRYVWIRDQCYAGQAVAAAGPHPLLDDAVQFVSARLLDHGDHLRPAYTVAGGPVPDQQKLDLPGYPGGHNQTGNWVNQQFQLDAFGETLLLFAAAARYDHLNGDHHRAAGVAARAIGGRWREPDAGIWEIDNQAWTHSRLICAAGLRAYAAYEPAAGAAAAWLTLADRIVADTGRHATHPTGRWQRSATDPHLDAALLLPPLRGAVPADDPRTAATLNAYLAELTVDGYAYRFRHDSRPLGQAEGSFTLCGFLTAQALHQQGRTVEAARWYERTRAAHGPPELYSEEFDAGEHQLRGNLPQAFVHALHLQTSAQLAADPQ